MSKLAIYQAIQKNGGRATWKQIEQTLEGTGHDKTNLRAGITRLLNDGCVRWERSPDKYHVRVYVISAPYPERNVWTLQATKSGALVPRRIEA